MKTINVPATTGSPGAGRPWFRMETTTESETDVYIFEEIGYDWWTDSGITAKTFVEDLNKITTSTINVHINCLGGDCWDGVTIYNSLVQHPATVNVIIDGIAASAASFIAMSGDSVTMRTGSQMMVHDAWTVAVGNSSDLLKVIESLDSVSDSIASIYAERTGSSAEVWREVMRAETWYTAEEAVSAGLADRVAGRVSVEKPDASRLALFAFAGRENAPQPVIPKHKTVGTAYAKVVPDFSDFTHHELSEKEGTIMNGFKAALVAALGLDADSTEDQVLAAVENIASPVASAPSLAVPDGAVVVDAGVLAELQEKAATGMKAEAALVAQRRDAVIEKAKSEGRVSAATAQVWRDRMDTDEDGVIALLETLPANTIPVSEIGHSDDIDEAAVARDELRAKMNGGQHV